MRYLPSLRFQLHSGYTAIQLPHNQIKIHIEFELASFNRRPSNVTVEIEKPCRERLAMAFLTYELLSYIENRFPAAK